jgi:hypothetical protein
MTSRLRAALFLILATSVALPPATARAQAATEAQRRAEAKAHFLRGVDHTDRGEWEAALAEFLKSREILPNAKNTYNAAVCLRHVNRFDEALDMYEALLRDYPNADDRKVAEKELAELKTSIGAIAIEGGAPGAQLTIDGRDRGKLPLTAPIRVSAGTHSIRVLHDKFLPFEKRIDLVGMQTETVNVRLTAVTAGARLHVAERSGGAFDVVVDGKAVGKTPWDGVLPPGDHSVLLRGENGSGTQPTLARVSLSEPVTLDLAAEKLDAQVSILPSPPSANIAIDGVPVGHGTWAGYLRSGRHTFAANAEGYLASSREVDLPPQRAQTIEMPLERDLTGVVLPTASLGLELDLAPALAPLFGGEVTDSCTGACSSSLPFGGRAAVHGIYQAPSGFGAALDVGVLLTNHDLDGRPTSVTPRGLEPNRGTAKDSMRLFGLTAGASGHYRAGTEWPITVRLGAGIFLGSITDSRSATLTNRLAETYRRDLRKSAGATSLFVAPELRVGRRFGEHFELSLGAEVLIMKVLSKPVWNDDGQIITTNTAGSGDGLATFPSETFTGPFIIVVSPGLGARYDF